MQQTIGLKRFMISRVGVAALAFAVLLSGIAGVAGLAVTGDLPWVQAESPAADRASVRAQTLVEQRSRFYTHKEARQEALELRASELADRATRLEKLRRFYEHKEQKMDALP
jgi:hypothetical protein